MSMPNNGRTDKLLTFHCIKIEVASKKQVKETWRRGPLLQVICPSHMSGTNRMRGSSFKKMLLHLKARDRDEEPKCISEICL